MKELTRTQWDKVLTKFFWIKIGDLNNNIEIVKSYLTDETSDWWFYDELNETTSFFAFGDESDLIRFKLWLSDIHVVEN